MANVSSVNRHRINTYQVNRKNNNLDVVQVDRLQPVNPVQNNTASANDNFAMFSEVFYGKLMDLKAFYKQFYHHEQALEDVIRRLKKGHSSSITTGLKELVIELVEKYNLAFQSLKTFEKEIGLQHSRLLVKTIRKYEIHINRLGIRLLTTGLLKIDIPILERSLEYHPEYLQALIESDAGLLYELNHQFKSVQTQPNKSQFQKIQSSLSETMAKGSLVDEQS